MQLIGILFVAALWVKYFWVFVAAAAAIWATRWGRREWRIAQAEAAAARVAECERVEGLRARADQQHAWRMSDDPRGTYGETQDQHLGAMEE